MRVARLIAIVAMNVSAIVAFAALTPASAYASGCTDTFTNTAGGSWSTASNWSKKAAPTSEEEACITEKGTYTVTIAAATENPKALTIGASSGKQSLDIEATASGYAELNTGAGGLTIGANGSVTLTESGVSGNTDYLIGGAVLNEGTISTLTGTSGGERRIEPSVTNKGTISIGTTTVYNPGGSNTLTNEGALDLAENATLKIESSGTLTDGSGGSINATGNGAVTVGGNATYNQGAGSTNGTEPVIAENSHINYTGSGASLIHEVNYYSYISGNIAKGQTLVVEGCVGGSDQGIVVAKASFENAGTIELTSADYKGSACSGTSAESRLKLESGVTLTNTSTGKILVEPGIGGEPKFEGSITNKGVVDINTTTADNLGSTTFTNEGEVNLANSTQFSFESSTTFTNASGSLNASGNANVVVGGSATFNQGAGSTNGTEPVIAENSHINYTGSGASLIHEVNYYGYISGNIAKGQTLVVEGCVGGSDPGIVVAKASFENAGTIELTSADYKGSACSGTSAESRLKLESGVTLTNTSTGKILVEPGIGGEPKFEGSITNKGVVDINTTTADNLGSTTFTNEGEVNLANSTQFSFESSTTFTNASGSLNASGNANVVVGGSATFNQGAGSTNGTEPVIAENSHINYTGSGASLIHEVNYYGYISGNIAKGQTLVVEGCVGGSDPGIVVAKASFENAGTIEFTSAKHGTSDCGASDESRLKVESGVTVTNTSTGKILVEPGIGGARKFEGSITNKGVVDINATTVDNTGSATFVNEGEVKLAAATQFSFESSTTFTNGAGGLIDTVGDSSVSIGGSSTFNQGAGNAVGNAPISAEDSHINYTGNGTSVIHESNYYGYISGNIAKGQTLIVEGCVGGADPGIVVASKSFENAGTIELTSAKHGTSDCGASDESRMKLESGVTLTNTGSILVEAGVGGARSIEGTGALDNERFLSLNTSTPLKITGPFTQGSNGTLIVPIASTSSYGALSTSGVASLGGALDIEPIGGFKGELGRKFTVITAASHENAFIHEENAVISPNLWYKPIYGSSTTFSLEVAEGTPPEKPPVDETKPTISGTPKQGDTLVAQPGTWKGEAVAFSYQWLRCTAAGTECGPISGAYYREYLLTGADAGHRVTVQVTAYNASGAGASAEPSSPSAVVSALPLHASAGESIEGIEGTAVTLDGSASTPASEVTNYKWVFADGSEEAGADDSIVHHTYAAAGTYKAQLTVSGKGEESSATVNVIIHAKPKLAEGAIVNVRSSGGGLQGVTVLYVGSGGARAEATSSSTGEAVLAGLPEGSDTVYVYKSAFKPAVATIAVNGSHDGSTTVTLSSGEVATTELKSKELTYEEVVKAGINPYDPANQNVYKFVIKLAFIESPAPPVKIEGNVNSAGQFVGETGAEGGGGGGWSCGSGGCESGGGGGGGEERIIAQPEVVEGHPLIQWLILHGKAAVLKQFFEVSMIIQNLSPEPFELAKGTATLNLPEGLSLAPTTAQQSLTNEVPAVPGGGNVTTNWIIRGDKPGEYNLSANYNSTLEPFNAPVSVQAALANPLKVWGKEAMTLKVKADEGKLHEGVPYHVYVGVENKSDVPLYNVNLTIEEEPHENFIFQPEQQFSELVGELKPGETFFVKRPYILIPDAESVSVFNPALSSATFDGEKEHPGENIEKIKAPTLYPLESGPSIPGYVHLKWTPVSGAEGYEVFSTQTLETPFTNTPRSVLPSSTSKTAVTELPASATEAYVPASSTEALWYAVSTIVGGHLELESSPMVKATAPAVTVSSVSPASGTVNGGTPITIKGTGFVSGAKVEIAQGHGSGPTAIQASDVVVVSSTEITAVTGGGAIAGAWNLYVIDSGGTSPTNAPGDDYTYNYPVPTVSSVSPASGTVNGGTPITIKGTGFVSGAKVEIAQGHGSGPTAIQASDVVVVSSTEITAVTGGGAIAGAWNLYVIDSGGTSPTNAPGDDYTYNYPVPTVSSVSPASGTVNGGTPITIKGTGFVSGAKVEIAQGHGSGPTAIQASDVVVVSSTEITAVTGGGAIAGAWNLYVIDSGGTSPTNAPGDDYTYNYPVPTVSSVSPASGTVNGGTPITIKGTGFVSGAKVEIAQGHGSGPTAIQASDVVVVSSTEITAVTGGGAIAGAWNLYVIDSGGTSPTNAPGDDYTYN